MSLEGDIWMELCSETRNLETAEMGIKSSVDFQQQFWSVEPYGLEEYQQLRGWLHDFFKGRPLAGLDLAAPYEWIMFLWLVLLQHELRVYVLMAFMGVTM